MEYVELAMQANFSSYGMVLQKKAQEQEFVNMNSLTFLLGFEVATGKLCIFHLKTSALVLLASLENIKAEILN